ncbi:MAG: hypothetical protein MRJ68_21175 [Nitrospira sp.]|nr:hypothetical protein [Nitrospira sp.]
MLRLGAVCPEGRRFELLRMSEEETGYRDNDSVFWMHPMRANQFWFMEIAPFPYILKKQPVGKSYSYGVQPTPEWCELAGKAVSRYTILTKSARILSQKAWLVVATSMHPTQPSSTLVLYYSPRKGPLAMYYMLANRTNVWIERKD